MTDRRAHSRLRGHARARAAGHARDGAGPGDHRAPGAGSGLPERLSPAPPWPSPHRSPRQPAVPAPPSRARHTRWPGLLTGLCCLLAVPVATATNTAAHSAARGAAHTFANTTGTAADAGAAPLTTMLDAHCPPLQAAGPPRSLGEIQDEGRRSVLGHRVDTLALVCEGWAQVRRSPRPGAAAAAEWGANAAIGLYQAGRLAEAQAMAEATYQASDQRTAGSARIAARAAGLLAALAFQARRLDEAVRWSERGLVAQGTLATTGQDARQLLHLRHNHAALLARSGRIDEAEAGFRASVARASRDLPTQAELMAASLQELATLMGQTDRLHEALAISQRLIALRARWTPQNTVQLALAHNQLARVQMRLMQHDEARASLDQALVLLQARAAADPGLVRAGVLNASGLLHFDRGHIDAARQAWQEAWSLVRAQQPDSPREAEALRWLGEAQSAAGDLGAALASFRRARLLLESSGRSFGPATLGVWLGLVHLHLTLGDPASAQEAMQSLEARLPGMTVAASDSSRLQQWRAALAQRQGDAVAARQALQRADALLPPAYAADHPWRLELSAARCRLDAAQCAPLAAVLAAPGSWLPPSARAKALLALAHQTEPAGPSVDGLARSAEALAAGLASGQRELVWPAQALHARQLAARGQTRDAIAFGKLALDELQQMRGSLGGADTAAADGLIADKHGLYREVAEWLLTQQRFGEAVEVLNLLKRSELDDFHERAAPRPGQALSLTGQEESLRAALADLASADRAALDELRLLQRRANRGTLGADERRRLERLTAEAEARSARIRTQLAQVVARAMGTASAGGERAGSALPAIRAPEAADTLHVYLLTGTQQLSLLMVGTAHSALVQIDRGRDALAADVLRLLDRIGQRRGAQQEAAALYQLIARPVDLAAQRLGARRLVLWLDGPLRYLPFGLLDDGRGPMGVRYAIQRAAPMAAGVGAASANLAAPAALPVAGRLSAWGVTRALQGLPALPGVAEELCRIVDGPVSGLEPPGPDCGPGHGLISGQAVANDGFSQAALATLAQDRRPDIVHLATHFVLRPGNIGRSWLLLGDGQRLTLQQLAQGGLGQRRLVTLSGCETGTPGQAGGDRGEGGEVDGLADTLLHRGASAVLASLWRVADHDTARFMPLFYAALKQQPDDPARALQQARRSAAGQGMAPEAWAAFTLTMR